MHATLWKMGRTFTEHLHLLRLAFWLDLQCYVNGRKSNCTLTSEPSTNCYLMLESMRYRICEQGGTDANVEDGSCIYKSR